MKAMKLFAICSGLLSMVLLSGCATTPERLAKFEYEPAYPTNITQPEAPRNGSLYQVGSMDLFNDIRARRVGDIITVNLQEVTSAKKNAAATEDKSNATTLGAPTLLGGSVNAMVGGVNLLGNTSLSSTEKFKGKGDASQSNSIKGSISVTVIEIIPNGNLVVRGEKWVTINQGEEVIRFAGIIRPSDISTNNTIPSTKVADARIIYTGDGVVNDATRQGWLSQFFSKFWPW